MEAMKIEKICLGQIFTDDGDRVDVKNCWMLVCVENSNQDHDRDENENGTDQDDKLSAKYYIMPLLPNWRLSRKMLPLRRHDEFDLLVNQPIMFEVSDVKQDDFLRKMPELDDSADLGKVLGIIKNVLQELGKDIAVSVNDVPSQQLCLATMPSGAICDEETGRSYDMIFLLSDGKRSCSDVHIVPFDAYGIATYDDFVDTARRWRILQTDIVTELFRKMSNTIRAEGLVVCPTIWEFANGKTWTCYDLLADWEDTNDGIYTQLGDIVISHQTGTHVGKITLREVIVAKRMAS